MQKARDAILEDWRRKPPFSIGAGSLLRESADYGDRTCDRRSDGRGDAASASVRPASANTGCPRGHGLRARVTMKALLSDEDTWEGSFLTSEI